jgi:hypothetical protein
MRYIRDLGLLLEPNQDSLSGFGGLMFVVK